MPKYTYYRIGSDRPIRARRSTVVVDGVVGTEVPDPVTGELMLDQRLLSCLDGDDTWEIDEAEFERLLAAYQQKIAANKKS